MRLICSFCGSTEPRPRSRWTESGYSPWCPPCHARFAQPGGAGDPYTFSISRPGRRPEGPPEGYVELDVAAAMVGLSEAEMRDGLKRQRFRGVERIRRQRKSDKGAVYYLHQAQLERWILARQFSTHVFDAPPGKVRPGFSHTTPPGRAASRLP